MTTTPSLAALAAHFAGMPPVAAMQPRLDVWDAGVLRLRDSRLLMFQTTREAVPALMKLLPDAEPPTVMQLDGQDTLALQTLCRGTMTWQRLEDLRQAGARGLMVLPVERMLA